MLKQKISKMKDAALSPSDSSETMIVKSPILASAWYKQQTPKVGQRYSQTSIYLLLHISTFDLRTNFSEHITLCMYSKFDIRISLNILKFNMPTFCGLESFTLILLGAFLSLSL